MATQDDFDDEDDVQDYICKASGITGREIVGNVRLHMGGCDACRDSYSVSCADTASSGRA
jgi:hypothetical protein